MKSFFINTLLVSLVLTSCVYRSKKKSKKKAEAKKTDMTSLGGIYEGGYANSDHVPRDLYKRILVRDNMEFIHPITQEGICKKGVHIDSNGEPVAHSDKCLSILNIQAADADRQYGYATIQYDGVIHEGRYNVRHSTVADANGVFGPSSKKRTYIHFEGNANAGKAFQQRYFLFLDNNDVQIRDLNGDYYSTTSYIHDSSRFHMDIFFQKVIKTRGKICNPTNDDGSAREVPARCKHSIKFKPNGQVVDFKNSGSYQLEYKIDAKSGIITVYGTKRDSRYWVQYLILDDQTIVDYNNGVQGSEVWKTVNGQSMSDRD